MSITTLLFFAFTASSAQKVNLWEESLKSATEEALVRNQLQASMKAHKLLGIGTVMTSVGIGAAATGIYSIATADAGDRNPGGISLAIAGVILAGGGYATIFSASQHKKKETEIIRELYRRKGIQLSAGVSGVKVSF